MATGIVSWYQLVTGYTEITPDGGGDTVTGHYSRISGGGSGLNAPLTEGQHVSYEMILGPQDFMVAIEIQPIGPPVIEQAAIE